MLKFKSYKEAPLKDDKINRYDSGTYTTHISSTDVEILVAIKVLKKLIICYFFKRIFFTNQLSSNYIVLLKKKVKK